MTVRKGEEFVCSEFSTFRLNKINLESNQVHKNIKSVIIDVSKRVLIKKKIDGGKGIGNETFHIWNTVNIKKEPSIYLINNTNHLI